MSDYAIQYALQVNKDTLTPSLKKALSALKHIDKLVSKLSGKKFKIDIDTNAAMRKIKALQREASKATATAASAGGIRRAGSSMAGLPALIPNATRRGGLPLPQSPRFTPRATSPLLALPPPMPQDADFTSPARSPSKRRGKGGMTAMQGAGSALGGAAYLAVGLNAALELDAATTALSKATDLEGEALGKLRKQADSLESATGSSSASIMLMMADAAKAGIAVENLSSNVEDSTKIAVAFDMSTQEASTAITNLRNSFFAGQDYDTQQKGLMKLASAMSYVADRGESSEAYLANFTARASALKSVMGASEESIIAAGATFEAIGIPAETASRAMNSAQMSMVGLAGNAKALKSLGLNPKQFKADVEKDLIGTIFKVIQSTEKLGKLGQAETLTSIFGLGFADEMARGGAAVDIFTKNLALANDTTEHATALEAAYRLQNESLTASFNKVTKGLKSVIGTSVGKFFKGLTSGAETLVVLFKQYPVIVDFATALSIAGVAAGAFAIAMFAVTSPILAILIPIATAIMLFKKFYDSSATLRGVISSLGSVFGLLDGSLSETEDTMKGISDAFTLVGMGIGTIVYYADMGISRVVALGQALYASVTGDLDKASKIINQLDVSEKKKEAAYVDGIDADLKRIQGINDQANSARNTAGINGGNAATQSKTAEATAAQKAVAELSTQAAQKQIQAGDNQIKVSGEMLKAVTAMNNAASKLDGAAGKLSAAGAGLGSQGRE